MSSIPSQNHTAIRVNPETPLLKEDQGHQTSYLPEILGAATGLVAAVSGASMSTHTWILGNIKDTTTDNIMYPDAYANAWKVGIYSAVAAGVALAPAISIVGTANACRSIATSEKVKGLCTDIAKVVGYTALGYGIGYALPLAAFVACCVCLHGKCDLRGGGGARQERQESLPN